MLTPESMERMRRVAEHFQERVGQPKSLHCPAATAGISGLRLH